ncbi:MAG TPA: carboxypeptidase regulatory-like domain-containing protein [Planctomycetes bacterium]|nr:carboxypeptidase regulatory-like domain-containing protein [Planctomycetota bacterium]
MKSLPAILLALVLVCVSLVAFFWPSSRGGAPSRSIGGDPEEEVAGPGHASPPAPGPRPKADTEAPGADRRIVDTQTRRFGEWDSGAECRIVGRVAVPEGVPFDETLQVLSLSRRPSPEEMYGVGGLVATLAEGKPAPPELLATAPVDEAGSFQIPVPGDTEEAWLVVDGRFLFTGDPKHVEVGTGGTILLQPMTGGAIEGRVHFPEGISSEVRLATRAALDIDSDNLSMGSMDRDWVFTRSAPVTEDGSFELRAVLPGRTLLVTLTNEELANTQRGGIEIEPGQTMELDLEMRVGGTLRGLVVDPDGSPIPGAEVLVVGRFLFGFPTGQRVRGEADEHGTFELKGVPEGRQNVFARADGFLQGEPVEIEVVDGATLEDVLLSLSSGASIEGEVRFLGGRSVAGAEVRVGFDPSARMGAAAIQASKGAKGAATSDERGHFRVSGLGKGPFEVLAWAAPPEEAPDDTPWIARLEGISPDSHDLVLTLEPPSKIRGRVVDTAGHPVEAFEVSIRPHGIVGAFARLGREDDRPQDRRTLSVQDADGRFEIREVRRGTWDLSVSAPGYAPSTIVELEMPTDEGKPLVIPLEVAAQISGRVLSPTGEPVAGAKVTVRTEGSQALARLLEQGQEPEAHSVADGSFELYGLQSGTVSLVATAPGSGSSPAVDVTVEPGERTTGIVLTLREGGRIRGILYGKNGDPLADARVIAQNTSTFLSSLTLTGADGTFLLEHLDPGDWTISGVRVQEGAGESIDDVASMMDNLVFQPVKVIDGEETYVVLGAPPENPVQVSGRITSASDPVGEGVITFTPAGKDNFSGLKLASIDGDGAYSVELDGPGSYHVQVQILSGSAALQETVEYNREIPEGRTLELDFELPGGSIRGTVYGPDGDPLPGARVSLATDGGIRTGTFLGGQFAELTTEQNGSYAFHFLRPGTYTVAAGGSAFGTALGSAALGGRVVHNGIRLGEGDSLQGIDFRLQRGGSIEGYVRDLSGSPVEGLSIFIRNGKGNPMERFSMIATGPDGSFSYVGLSPGEYTVHAQGKGLASPREARVIVREAEATQTTLTVEPGTTLIVTVVDVSGDEVSGRISVRDDDGREYSGIFGYAQVMERLTQGFEMDEQRVGPLPAGHYTVRVESDDGRSAQKPVNLNGQSERRLKIRLR